MINQQLLILEELHQNKKKSDTRGKSKKEKDLRIKRSDLIKDADIHQDLPSDCLDTEDEFLRNDKLIFKSPKKYFC